MAKTAVADIIIPTQFEKYAIERTAELSAFGQCGIIEHSPVFDELAAGGGRTVEMPFWKDLSATRQLLSDSGSLTVNKITTDKDIARIHNDAQAWSVNHTDKNLLFALKYAKLPRCGYDCADALRYLVATKPREVVVRKLRGV